MSNVIQIKKTKRVKLTAHQITVDLMPEEVKSRLISAAITLGFLYGDGAFGVTDDVDTRVGEAFDELSEAVSIAGNYTVPVEIEVDEPV